MSDSIAVRGPIGIEAISRMTDSDILMGGRPPEKCTECHKRLHKGEFHICAGCQRILLTQ